MDKEIIIKEYELNTNFNNYIIAEILIDKKNVNKMCCYRERH